MTTSIRILVTDDHAVLRAGLTALLNAEPDLTVVGEAADGSECLHVAQALLAAPEAAISSQHADTQLAQLSEREQEVLKLVTLGYSNKEIAGKLFLSVKTVETYKARLMEKLEITTRAALVHFALQSKLLDEDE